MAGRKDVRSTLANFIAPPAVDGINQVFTSFPKRIDYSVAIQLFHHSMERNSEDAMNDLDNVVDNLKTVLRSDHQFGDPSGNLVWQGAEPVISASYGEPMSNDGTSTETWAIIRFDVTQMIQA